MAKTLTINLLTLSFLLLSSCYTYQAYQPQKDEEPLPIEKQIEPDKKYKIVSDSITYTGVAGKWEQDSLTLYDSYKKRKETKIAKKDIKEVQIRQFSRGRSDALTFGIYGAFGAALYLLLR